MIKGILVKLKNNKIANITKINVFIIMLSFYSCSDKSNPSSVSSLTIAGIWETNYYLTDTTSHLTSLGGQFNLVLTIPDNPPILLKEYSFSFQAIDTGGKVWGSTTDNLYVLSTETLQFGSVSLGTYQYKLSSKGDTLSLQNLTGNDFMNSKAGTVWRYTRKSL